jgi:hypothetical protein
MPNLIPAAIAARLKEYGLIYKRPNWADREEDTQILEEAFRVLDLLDEHLAELKFLNEITRELTMAEPQTVRFALFEKVVAGKWTDTDDDLIEMIIDVAPSVRLRR